MLWVECQEEKRSSSTTVFALLHVQSVPTVVVRSFVVAILPRIGTPCRGTTLYIRWVAIVQSPWHLAIGPHQRSRVWWCGWLLWSTISYLVWR